MNAREMIKRHEGYRQKPYTDTTGNITIGYGHNLTALGLSDKIIEAIFDEDVTVAYFTALKLFPSFKKLGVPRQGVLMNMAFNLGEGGLSKFKRMRVAIEAGQWDKAAAAMLDSKWAKQVGARATELAAIMRAG